jgi:hypothetical protein
MSDSSLERDTVRAMIRIYCRDNHQSDQLCDPCAGLQNYSEARLAKCPFGIEKPTCQNCPVHCYEPLMREQIREVMRYAGPRMIWHHPLLTIRHVIHNSRTAPDNKRGANRTQK